MFELRSLQNRRPRNLDQFVGIRLMQPLLYCKSPSRLEQGEILFVVDLDLKSGGLCTSALLFKFLSQLRLESRSKSICYILHGTELDFALQMPLRSFFNWVILWIQNMESIQIYVRSFNVLVQAYRIDAVSRCGNLPCYKIEMRV